MALVEHPLRSVAFKLFYMLPPTRSFKSCMLPSVTAANMGIAKETATEGSPTGIIC